MNNNNHLNSLQAILNGVKFNDFNLRKQVEKNFAGRQVDDDSSEQREVIRRLRIQNKKLLEQLELLKEHSHEKKLNHRRAMQLLDELAKLNKVLGETVRGCKKLLSQKSRKR